MMGTACLRTIPKIIPGYEYIHRSGICGDNRAPSYDRGIGPFWVPGHGHDIGVLEPLSGVFIADPDEPFHIAVPCRPFGIHQEETATVVCHLSRED